ncbi:MAG: AAA family ATPase [Candidatus Pacebacteria bacterium]|nr:AAA family ATPase [Candidatus Paceibacterota bacterium]
MKTKLIAVVGLPGSGKTETIEYLKEKYNWPNIYLGEATFDRLKSEGLEITQPNEKMMREKIRQELGMAAYAILAMEKIEKKSVNHDIITLESLYSWEEYITLKEKYNDNFQVIAVYASPKIREERLKTRNLRPLKTTEEFIDRDYSQIINLKQAGPIARADYTIINESSLDDLHQVIDKIISKIIAN